jgi:hypothetical protein
MRMSSREDRSGTARRLVGQRDHQHVAMQPPSRSLNPRPQIQSRPVQSAHQHDMSRLHEQRPQLLVAAFEGLAQDGTFPGRLLLGHRPSQAPKSRPTLKPAPVPLAATTADEITGPTPGTLTSYGQCPSWAASASISVEIAIMGASS